MKILVFVTIFGSDLLNMQFRKVVIREEPVAIFGSDFCNPYFRKMGGENMEHGAIFGSDFHKSAMNSWQEGWSSGGTTNRVSL